MLGQTLTKSLQDLYEQYGLTKKILAYVKYEGANPNTMMYSCFEINCKL